MDKYEYKVRSEEIKELIARKEYVQAAEIADTIDWRRVKSVMMLCTISDLYKINRRYEDSHDLLLLAYDRHPGGRTIVYALCELSIKMGNVTQAWEYYKEYMQIAPKDSGRYILQYKIYEAEEVNLEERIAVLEELKNRDYRERWAYELAYLYHRIGLASKCVDECDEMIVWFGDGKYVTKAMELKMLHQPLTSEQQVKYDNRFAPVVEESAPVEELYGQSQEPAVAATTTWSGAQVAGVSGLTEVEFATTRKMPVEEIDIQVKTMDPSQCNTINLQEEVAAGLRQLWEDESQQGAQQIRQKQMQNEKITQAIMAPMMETDSVDRRAVADALNTASNQEITYVAEAGEEIYTGESGGEDIHVTGMGQDAEKMSVASVLEAQEAYVVESEAHAEDVFVAGQSVDETGGIEAENATEDADGAESGTGVSNTQAAESESEGKQHTESEITQEDDVDQTAATVMEQLRKQHTGELPKEMEEVLSMESDGQMSFVVPEKEAIEKQITGQISIADIMLEWERRKKEIEEKSKEKILQNVKRDTGPMFTEFEAAMRDDLLEQLQQGKDPQAVIARAEGRIVDEDGILVPPSLLEDAQEDFVEDYEAISPEEARLAVEAEAQEGIDETCTEDVPQETEEATCAEVAVQEGIGETYYIEDVPQETVEATYAGETVQEGIGETYIEDVPQETVEATYAEAEAQEVIEETWAEETMEEVYFEEAIQEFAEEVKASEVSAKCIEDEVSESDSEKNTEAVEITLSSEDEVEELIEIEAPDEEEEAKSIISEEAGIDYETISMPISEVETAMQQEEVKLRNLTREERELFGPFIQGKTSRQQLVQTIDNTTMAAYTGNVVITGAEGLDTLGLAKNIIRNIQMTDSNFSGKIAKISGESLNKRDVIAVLEGLDNGALIIQKASAMNAKTVDILHKALQQEHRGIIVILEGTKKAMNTFLEKHARLQACFTGRIDMEALSDASLVAFGKKYAREKEYTIDELGDLALSRKIAERQTSDHAVTIVEVKEIIDEAIESASRKTLGHFIDVLMAKRYDDEDMIIIREKDFR